MDGEGLTLTGVQAGCRLDGSEGGLEPRERFWVRRVLEDVSRCCLARCLDTLGLVGFYYSVLRAFEP